METIIENRETRAETKEKETISEAQIKEKPKISGAEALIRAFISEGVECVFGYPGGANLPIYDAFYNYRDAMKHVLVRHEQGAVHAAQGYARATGKTGVCFATSGPGATNLLTGITDAKVDSTPLVCITGQVVSKNLGIDAFQETDVVGISMPVTKWNYQITSAKEIPDAVSKAFYIARSGRPGPVLLDITKDAQLELFDFEYDNCRRIRSYHPYLRPKQENIELAAHLINNAKKPFMIVGQGVLLSGAEKQVIELAEKANIPIASTLLGLSAVPTGHSHFTGMVGLHGNYAPNIKTNECDVLIAVGMRFDDRVTGNLEYYARQAKVIHIEIDPAEIDKNVKTEVAIVADAKIALNALLPKIAKNVHLGWLQEFHQCDKVEYEKIIHKDITPVIEELTMGEVVHQISEKTKGEAILVTDVGQNQMAGARYYRFKKRGHHITSGGLGTMGFALPAAIGAKIGNPNEQVIALMGDGGFQMTMQELGTVFQSKIPLKMVVLNNSFLGMIRQLHDLYYNERDFFGEFINPDFTGIAQKYGIKTKKVSQRNELPKAVDEMLQSEEAFFLEVKVKKINSVYPTIPAGKSVSDMILG